MTENLYTLDLGQTYGPKLERLARQASFEDVEEFAAIILCHALDALEAGEREEDAALAAQLRNETVLPSAPGNQKEMDDDIRF